MFLILVETIQLFNVLDPLLLIVFVQDNLFEWHFTVRGPPDSDFDGGVYHGRIVLPPEYPMKPPSIILLTVRILGFLKCFLEAVKCSLRIPIH